MPGLKSLHAQMKKLQILLLALLLRAHQGEPQVIKSEKFVYTKLKSKSLTHCYNICNFTLPELEEKNGIRREKKSDPGEDRCCVGCLGQTCFAI